MDSMMAVEIKQTLKREFDILLTTQDIRMLNFSKLKQMAITPEQEKIWDLSETDTNDLKNINMLFQKMKNSDFVPNILIELVTKKEVNGDNIIFVPGIDNCSKVFKFTSSEIKYAATCLQHGVLNIPNESHTVMKSAAYLLPKEFFIVGYSYGSLIVIELARLLETNNLLGRLILIDGAPDLLKLWINKFMPATSLKELQNLIIVWLLKVYTKIDEQELMLKLNKCNTVEEKLKIFHTRFPMVININTLTTENQRLMYFTIYNHIIAILNYNISSLPRLKSPITLLKPTFPIISFPEEDYGLHRGEDKTPVAVLVLGPKTFSQCSAREETTACDLRSRHNSLIRSGQ
ncbi:fatty acid synthase-like [Cardiocondyla obscurior]|uniref:fatty acid synthase-like n=1 Tax=Cardiocondyla obscurior TaxID=286306 RepID=UPI003965881B